MSLTWFPLGRAIPYHYVGLIADLDRDLHIYIDANSTVGRAIHSLQHLLLIFSFVISLLLSFHQRASASATFTRYLAISLSCFISSRNDPTRSSHAICTMHLNKQQIAALAIALFSSRALSSGVGAVPVPKEVSSRDVSTAGSVAGDVDGIHNNVESILRRDPEPKIRFGDVANGASAANNAVSSAGGIAETVHGWWDEFKSHLKREPEPKVGLGDVASGASAANNAVSSADGIEQTVEGWWDDAKSHLKRNPEAKFGLDEIDGDITKGIDGIKNFFDNNNNNQDQNQQQQQQQKREPEPKFGLEEIANLGEDAINGVEGMFGHKSQQQQQSQEQTKRDHVTGGADGIAQLGENEMDTSTTETQPSKREPKGALDTANKAAGGLDAANSVVNGIEEAKEKIESWF